MKEIWRKIPGHSGYEVSDLGRVRSVNRILRVDASPRAGAHERFYHGKILRPGSSQGYPSVVLGKGRPGTLVHRLVLLAFVGPCPEGQEALHRNGDRSDARLSNLRYDTRSANNEDTSRHNRRKITVEGVREMRAARAAGATLRELSEQYGLCQAQVSNICRRQHYRHVA